MGQAETILTGLGEALRELRTEQRLSQMELSNRTGVHWTYIGGVERGERSPTVKTVAKLADALGVTMGELFSRAVSTPDG